MFQIISSRGTESSESCLLLLARNVYIYNQNSNRDRYKFDYFKKKLCIAGAGRKVKMLSAQNINLIPS